MWKDQLFKILCESQFRRCEDIKEIVEPEIGPKGLGTSEKQAPERDLCDSRTVLQPQRWVRIPVQAWIFLAILATA